MRLRIHCPATNLPNHTHGTQSTHHKQEDEVLHFLISDSRAPLDLLPSGCGEDLAYLVYKQIQYQTCALIRAVSWPVAPFLACRDRDSATVFTNVECLGQAGMPSSVCYL